MRATSSAPDELTKQSTAIARCLGHVRILLPHLTCPRGCGALTLLSDGEARTVLPAHATAAIACSGRRHVFAVYGVIIDLLNVIEETRGPGDADAALDETTAAVKRYYDEFGWKPNEQNVLNDTAIYSKSDRAGHDVYASLSRRRLAREFGSGDFFLDAASGAIAHPEYLTYSERFRYHTCVDISFEALGTAFSKLQYRGFYLLADVTRLPFRNDTFDGIFSGYTIQHVVAERQEQAVRELYRVLAPGGRAVIVNGIAAPSWRTKLSGKLAVPSSGAAPAPFPTSAQPPSRLYCYPRPYGWWRTLTRSFGPKGRLAGFRLFDKEEFLKLLRDSPRWARIVHAAEGIAGRALTRASIYVALRLEK